MTVATVTISGFEVKLNGIVRETTNTQGTGTYSLNGASAGTPNRTFVGGIGSGNRTCYLASLGEDWERGIGTITSGSPDTLSRDLILESSNSDNAVNWLTTDPKDIYCVIPPELMDQIWPQPTVFTGALMSITRFTSSGTWTKPANLGFVVVKAVGGGGGSGGVSATDSGNASSSPGGGGGGYGEKKILAGSLGSTETVTIGAGGSAGSAGNNPGGNGGNTTFGGHITCNGGVAGTGAGASSLFLLGGGQGGTATGADFSMQGEDGHSSFMFLAGSTAVAHLQNRGGRSFLSGAAGPGLNDGGRAGRLYGGGATGATNHTSQPARAGAAGAAGYLEVWEYAE